MGILSTTRRILITGASRGIGKQAALTLARQGHTIVLAARTLDALRAVAGEIEAGGGHAEVLSMDVTDESSVRTAVAQMLARGPCDILVNNAGTCFQAPFLRQDPARLREEMELNYWGPQRLTRALLPAMIARREGTIVNVSSLLGFIGTPTTANYCGTKAALNAWTHALRGEVAGFGIRTVLFVAPHTRTELGAATEFDGVTSLPVEYTVRKLCRAIDRAPRQYAGSPVYSVLLRLAAWFPAFMERRLTASVKRLLPAAPPVAVETAAALVSSSTQRVP
ncbi:MAG TPA: SDR family NAD(P)-dependent oxidoreductase [Polyangiaceae bacterium]